MLRFFDGGGDHYGTTEINAKWTNSTGVVVSSGSGRFGGNSLRLADLASGSFLQKTLDAQPTWVVGLGIMVPGLPAASAPVVRLLDQGSPQCELRINPDGTLAVTRNGTPVSGGTSSFSLRTGSYYFIEFKVTLADAISVNTCKVRVNGADVLTVATGQDLSSTANQLANSVVFHGCVANTHIDDTYLCDGIGAANKDFLGDCRAYSFLANGPGDKSEWAVTGATDHYQAINQNPPNGDISYLSSSFVGQVELFHFADLATTGTIKGVQASLLARKDDSGARQVSHVIKSGGVEYQSAPYVLGTGYLYQVYVCENDPNTGMPWLVPGFNNAQFGSRVYA